MSASPEAAEFATKQDLAKRYGVHPRQIQKLLDDGRIPGYQLGPRIWRFKPEEVDAALRMDTARAEAENELSGL